MIRKDRIFLLILAVGFSTIWMACNRQRDPCLQPTTITVKLKFSRHADTGSAIIDTALPNIVAAALDIDTARLWINGTQKVPLSTIALILSPVNDSCRWIIQPDSANSLIDTVSFFYSRKLQFLSNACGYTYFFSLQSLKTTRYSIDSIKILNNSVTSNASIDHVQIFY